MPVQTLAFLQLLGQQLLARARTAQQRDRGSVTLEQVIIALGLFLLAVAVIAAITSAVNSRMDQITTGD